MWWLMPLIRVNTQVAEACLRPAGLYKCDSGSQMEAGGSQIGMGSKENRDII